MNILIATPLFPPDTAPTAAYIKDLAERLSLSHQVTILLYGERPESVAGVRFVRVSKHRFLPFRLFTFFFTFLREQKQADAIYIQNGPSVELPIVLASLLTRTHFIFHNSDADAHHFAANSTVRTFMLRLTIRRAYKVVTDSPHMRPEILPFQPYPEKQYMIYEESWGTHLEELDHLFRHGKK